MMRKKGVCVLPSNVPGGDQKSAHYRWRLAVVQFWRQ